MKIIKSFIPSILTILIFGLDRLSKLWIKRNMFYGEARPVAPFFSITHVENTGAAFGLGQNWNMFFIGSSIVILVALFVMARKSLGSELQTKAALALVIGGALGNLYDRITQGSVTDFLDFFVGAHHWPAFNVADSAICVGAVLLALFNWKPKHVPTI